MRVQQQPCLYRTSPCRNKVRVFARSGGHELNPSHSSAAAKYRGLCETLYQHFGACWPTSRQHVVQNFRVRQGKPGVGHRRRRRRLRSVHHDPLRQASEAGPVETGVVQGSCRAPGTCHIRTADCGNRVTEIHFILINCRADASLNLLTARPTPPGAFSGKVVWIVGSSQGLGEAMAVAMAKLGAKLILSSRSQRKLEASRTDEVCYGQLLSGRQGLDNCRGQSRQLRLTKPAI